VAGALLFQMAELLPGAVDRRRTTREARVQRRFGG
jgi:hypothetical protein